MPQLKKQIVNGKLKCSKCAYWLPTCEYGKSAHSSTGYRSCCKVCQKHYYDSRRRKIEFNSGIIGLYKFDCDHCKKEFVTKKSSKVYCSDKCRKRAWYEANERGK
ncbi:hypothetical protein [Sulfurimonas sp.]|uniref:hypothetical protein n=1 Tax=Sulfurimonas sp. TaxID=2022749 RepID=UPI00356767D5